MRYVRLVDRLLNIRIGSRGNAAKYASWMQKAARPARPKRRGTWVCQLDHEYITPPQLIGTRNDVEEATKIKVPT